MTWVKLDDGFPEHPKVLKLTDAAFRLHVLALCYAARNLTNGIIPHVWLTGGKGRALPKAVEQLIAGKLWTASGDDFEVHDYLEYQPSRSQVEQSRERGKDRVKRHRNALHDRDCNGSETLPRPVPSQEDRKKETDPTSTNPSVAVPPSPSSSLLVSPKQWAKAMEKHAFYGSRLRIPHVLHDELRAKLGGDNPTTRLLAWYSDLNTEIELTGEPIVDVFLWLRPRFLSWAADAVASAELERFRPKGV